MAIVIYECGCTSGGDLISPYCPVHTNMPIVKEIDNSTTKKQEKNIMTTENKETEEQEFLNAENEADNEAVIFDTRHAQIYEGGHIEAAIIKESPTKHDLNSQYGVYGRTVRPMIQFVDETTESRLANVREQMTFTRAKKTIRRTGWYFTESYSPCGEYMTTEEIKASIADVFGA